MQIPVVVAAPGGPLAAKHGHFMSKHDDLDGPFAFLRAAVSEQLEDSDEARLRKVDGMTQFRSGAHADDSPAE